MKARTDIPIIVLAAGRSARMRGADKLMQPVDGLPLIRRQAERARAATNGPVIVALPRAPHERYGALRGLDILTLPVADADEGMNASIRAAFAAIPKGSPAVMLLLADLPDLTENDLRLVIQAVEAHPENMIWRGATEDLKPGHPVIFATALLGAISRLRGDSGGREVVAMAGEKVVLVPLAGNRARRDLDTPEDWAAWRAGRKTGPSN